MIIQNVTPDRFQRFCRELQQSAQIAPLEASYTVPLWVNDTEYAVRLQPMGENQIAVLQALEIQREDGPTFTLIEDDDLLAAFLTLLLKRGVA